MSNQPPLNPYQAVAESTINPADLSQLTSTVSALARWQTMMALLLMVASGMVMLMFVFTFALGGSENFASMVGGLACAGGGMMLIYGLPAFMLWRAASRARDYARTPTESHLVRLASAQLSFWRTTGIIVLIIIGGYGSVVVAAMFLGAAAG